MDKPIHPDIPTDRAWQTGRRLYVRCGYKSQLNADLRAIGATWDADMRALWVGSTKRDAVVQAVRAAEGKRAEIESIKAAGRWVSVPYDASAVRDRAKELGGVWDGDQKRWAMPSDESATEVRGLRDTWQRDRDAAEQARRDAAREAQITREEQATRDERERAIDRAGRALSGETARFTEVSTRRMHKHIARQTARSLGSVVKLRDGRRGVITGVKIWFTGEDFASSVCWHPETHDQAHWDFRYTVEIVEPTAEELADDATKAAERADADAIHEVMWNAGKLTGARADDRWTTIPEEDRAGVITATSGEATLIRGGTLILTRDDRVVWQHPGYYDDYVRSEGISTDAELVERVRGLLAGGSRKRTMPGQLPTYYEVRVSE